MDYKPALALLFCFLLFSTTSQAEFKDPTRPMRFSSKTGSGHSTYRGLKLSAIFTSKQTKRVTINGVTAEQGDTILLNITILKILKSSVKIRQNGNSRTLYLLPKFKKKMSLSKVGHQQ